MKKTALIFGLLAIFLIQACAPQYRHSTQQELGQSLFVALKKNDLEGLYKLIPTRADFEDMLNSPEISEEERVRLNAEMQAMLDDFKNIVREAFEVVYRDAATDGVDWKNAKLIAVKEEDCRITDVELCDVSVRFASAGKKWEIFIDDAGKVAGGWVIGFDAIQWMGEIE